MMHDNEQFPPVAPQIVQSDNCREDPFLLEMEAFEYLSVM